MISVLICGISDENRKNITQNIEDTIGQPYELLYYDNKINPKSISTVYNSLKKQASGDYLCFIHEDIAFKTKNWGIEIQRIFQSDPAIGLLGVVGAKYKSRIPSSWTSIGHKNLVCNYEQHHKDGKEPEIVRINTEHALNQVVFVDGFFLCINKETSQLVSFDEEVIKGFHGYDFDLAMSVSKASRKIMVTNRILIAHYSDGSINTDWFVTHQLLCKKWEKDLPAEVLEYSFLERIAMEYSSFLSGWKFVNRLGSNAEKTSFFFRFFNLNFTWFFLYKKLRLNHYAK